MKSHLLLSGMLATASAVFILSGCASQEPDPGEVGATGDAIRFSAMAENNTRAEYTTNNLKSFNVFAYLTNPSEYADTTLYMDNVVVSKTPTNLWEYSPVEYWPTNSSLDFYAYAPDSWFTAGQSPKQPVHYTNNGYCTDLIYAVSLNRSKPSSSDGNAQICFNFRHALSKIDVNLRTTDETNLLVRVGRVTLMGTMMQGDFIFPSRSTDQTSATADPLSIGHWTNLSNPHGQVIYMGMDQSDILQLTTNYVNVNPVIPSYGEPGFSPFVLPQPLSWDINGTATTTDSQSIVIELSIYDATTYTKVWPNSDTPSSSIVPGSFNNDGYIRFPVSSSTVKEWLPGHHYVYNLTINAHAEMGEIVFGDPTVDSFIDVETSY